MNGMQPAVNANGELFLKTPAVNANRRLSAQTVRIKIILQSEQT